jgi:hypothetical protein
VDTGGVEEALDAPEAHAMGGGEGGGGGAVSVGGEQLSDVVLIEARAGSTDAVRSVWGHAQGW